jgi:hypothetical protein
MRTEEEIRGNLTLARAYLAKQNAQLITTIDPIEAAQTFHRCEQLRERIDWLTWVLGEKE